MKLVLRRILIGLAAAIILPPIVLWVWFRFDERVFQDQPSHFDLFVEAKFLGDAEGSLFAIVPNDERRPVEWMLNVEQFEVLDTVVIALRNISGERFYYTSWGAPLSRLRTDLIVYRGGVADSIPFGGFGCSTGVFLAPVRKNESVTGTMYNPLMFDPWSNYELPLTADSFPDIFSSIYGDSVAIRFSQGTYGLAWNHYPSQMMFSERIVVSTEKILHNWRDGKYAPFPDREPTMEEHFGIRNFPQ